MFMECFFIFFFVDFLVLDAEIFVMYICMVQCVCLVDELGNRTMRPCLSNAVKVQVPSFFFFFFGACVHVTLCYVPKFKD